MTRATLAAKNALRNRFRTALTVLGVAVAVVAFVMLRTTIWAWTVAVEAAAKDRVVTRHKITFVMPLPRRYVEAVGSAPGVKQVTWANWFGGKDPRHEREFFSALAVDAPTYFDVYDEMAVPAAEREAWIADRRGAIVGDVLAKKLGWKVGDRVALISQIFPGDWEFRIRGIYTATRKSVDRSQFVFHWAYLNEQAPPRMRDQVGWIVSRVGDPSRAVQTALALDRAFEEKEIQTLSQDERSFNQSFFGMMSAILKAIDVVSVVILAIMMLILGNTIAMGVRERTGEYAVLRALGFLPRHLAGFVLGEAALTGAAGGIAGIGLSYPVVQSGMGRWIEENLGAFMPYYRIQTDTAATAVGLAVVLGMLAAIVPAVRAARLSVVTALRRVG